MIPPTTLPIDSHLSLVRFRPSDAPAIFSLIDRNREHLSQFGDTTLRKYPAESNVLESIVNPIRPNRHRFGIWDGNTLVGSVNIEFIEGLAEVGYYLGQEFQGKKYMTKAVKRIVQYGFEQLGLDEIIAETANLNMPSRAVLFAAGFRAEKEYERDGTTYVMHALTRKEWDSRRDSRDMF
ncbi:MAG: GNAT family protein [Nanoarchaeota archaeon]